MRKINKKASCSSNKFGFGHKATSRFLLLLFSVMVLFLASVSSVTATEYYVSTTGDNSGDGSSGSPWLTIQHAINTVIVDDTIHVADGTYTITSAINVNKGVTITGNITNPGNVVVTYSGPSQTLDCFDMQANNVIVQGIKVVNGRYGFNFATTDPTGCTISNCVIDHCYEGAINIEGGSGHTISDNTITNCLTSGTKRGAIHIYGCPDTTIDANTLTDNGLTGAHATMGIYVKFTYPSSSSERVEIINNDISGMFGINADIQIYDAPYTYIYNNTISNSEDKGIAIFGIFGNPAYTSIAKRVEVIGNTISSTYYPGLQACNAPYTYFYNNTLTHCNYYGGDGTGDFDYASIHIDSGSAHCLIDSNTVSDGINGIQTWSNDVTITNNEIYDMGKTYNNTKTTVDGTYHNSAILYGDMYNVNMPTSATISNNNIHDNYWGLFVISTYAGTVTAEKNWWGDASGPGGQGPGTGDSISANVDYSPWLGAVPGTSPMTWYTDDSIQEAIDAASSGDTINVAAGTYNENLVIDKDITLQSSGATADTIINATDNQVYVVKIMADGVTLDGFTITGLANAGENMAAVITWGVDSCTITNNIITDNYRDAIDLYETGGAYSDYNTVSNNVINAPNGVGETYGIKIKGSHNTISGNEIYNADTSVHIWSWWNTAGTEPSETESPNYNIISGNTIAQGESGTANHKYGIEIKTGQHNEVTGNTISVTRAGIHLYTSHVMVGETNFDPRPANNIISDNTITGGEVGIVLLEGANTNTISGNTISGTSIAGILGSLSRWPSDWSGKTLAFTSDNNHLNYLQITGNTFKDNTLDNCGHGIAMEYADSNTIGIVDHGNTIKNNANTANIDYHSVAFTADYAGIYFDANSESNVVNYNNIVDNTGGLKNANTGETLDAKNNWWGDTTGPYHSTNPNGQGDTVSDNVDFDPWCTNSGCTEEGGGAGGASSISYISSWASTVKAALDWLFNRAEQDTDGVSIYLHKGWNKFKLPWFVLRGTEQDEVAASYVAGDYSVTDVLSSISGKYSYIAYYDGTNWRVYSPGVVENDFTVFPHKPLDSDYDFHIYINATGGARLKIPE